MDTQIILVYRLCDDMLKPMQHREAEADDGGDCRRLEPQRELGRGGCDALGAWPHTFSIPPTTITIASLVALAAIYAHFWQSSSNGRL